MTPLTHAAVATVICQRARKLRWGPFTWAGAFAVAFASHYLLDAIPHFEGVVPIRNYRHSLPLMAGIGSLGTVLALLLMRRNREAGRIWLVLFWWIGLGFYAFSWWRILTAGLGLAYIAWQSPFRYAVYYVAAGMLSVLPDLVPSGFRTMKLFHRAMHYREDWPNLVYLLFSNPPIPRGWRARLHEPSLLLAYGVEIVIEGLIFLGAVYLFSRERFLPESNEPAEISEALKVPEETGGARR